jgi:hypothetical protein
MLVDVIIPIKTLADGTRGVHRPVAPAGKHYEFVGMWYGEPPGVGFHLCDDMKLPEVPPHA